MRGGEAREGQYILTHSLTYTYLHLVTTYSLLTLSGKEAKEVPASTHAEPTGHKAHSTVLLATDRSL